MIRGGRSQSATEYVAVCRGEVHRGTTAGKMNTQALPGHQRGKR